VRGRGNGRREGGVKSLRSLSLYLSSHSDGHRLTFSSQVYLYTMRNRHFKDISKKRGAMTILWLSLGVFLFFMADILTPKVIDLYLDHLCLFSFLLLFRDTCDLFSLSFISLSLSLDIRLFSSSDLYLFSTWNEENIDVFFD
jgi:hypothetical protein